MQSWLSCSGLHVDDFVAYLLDQPGWTHLNLPAIAECEQRIQLGPQRYHIRKPGDVLHPEREPLPVLEQLKQSMGSMDFNAQYQQYACSRGRPPHKARLVRHI
jgi:hypothetical protein